MKRRFSLVLALHLCLGLTAALLAPVVGRPQEADRARHLGQAVAQAGPRLGSRARASSRPGQARAAWRTVLLLAGLLLGGGRPGVPVR